MKIVLNVILTSLCLFAIQAYGQNYSVSGIVESESSAEDIFGSVALMGTTYTCQISDDGKFHLKNVPVGRYSLKVTVLNHVDLEREVILTNKNIFLNLKIKEEAILMDSVVVEGSKHQKTFGITRLKHVEGTSIYAGKKSEVIVLKDITVNTATNNTRQIYSKVTGLNIWENDGAGIQLGIGGRGLSPNRASNFNTRQNGYDISADALGYPESYYSPAAESVDRIEVVRGAASLQYGTQFGGLVNFQLKKGPKDKKIDLLSRQTIGSFGFFNSFNSIGGTVGKANYYCFYQYKRGDGWRPNSEFNVHSAYFSASYKINTRTSVSFQYTFMDYLAHQPGGLTDKLFQQNPNLSLRYRNWFKVNWNLVAAIFDYRFSENVKVNSRFFGLVASRQALGKLTAIHRPDDLKERDLWVDNFRNFGNETRFLMTYKLFTLPSTLLVGSRIYFGKTRQRQGHGNAATTGSRRDFTFIDTEEMEFSRYVYPNKNYSIFAEHIINITPQLALIPGIRGEIISTNASGYYTNVIEDQAGNPLPGKAGIEESRESNRSFILAGAGISYQPHKHLEIYSNFSQNYRAINFNDMRVLNPNVKVDPDLKDEKGYTTDLGMRGNLGGILDYDIGAFIIYYNNRIGTILDPQTLNRIRTNVASSQSKGIETFWEIDFWKWIKREHAKGKLALFSNFSVIDARYGESKEVSIKNKIVELAPGIIFKTGLQGKYGRITCNYQFSYTGHQFTDATNATFVPSAVSGEIPAYYVMDLSVQYKINKYFELSTSINNISDNRYFTRRADGYPGPGIIPSDPRSFYLTLQVKL